MCVFSSRKEDSGLLVYKDHLPVSQVVIGDTSRAGSEAKLTVGPLRCEGDREWHTPPRTFSTSRVQDLAVSNVSFLLVFEGNYWNAASFSSPASYLHFQLYRGEACSDISFYFKTSSTHGVFLENQGADFFHIELRGKCLNLKSPEQRSSQR